MLQVGELPVTRWPPCGDVTLHWPAAWANHLALLMSMTIHVQLNKFNSKLHLPFVAATKSATLQSTLSCCTQSLTISTFLVSTQLLCVMEGKLVISVSQFGAFSPPGHYISL